MVGKDSQKHWYAREWLDFTGKKQRDLVEGTDLSKGRVSDLVSGKRRFNSDNLIQFARIIGCSPSELLGVNPFEQRPLWDIWEQVPQNKRQIALEMLEGLARKKAGGGS
jgi:plasmid maintenance system antidote protein VapI